MQNALPMPIKKIKHFNFSLPSIKEIYNNLFIVPEDQKYSLADTQMEIDQLNDTILFAIKNNSIVRIQMDIKNKVLSFDGQLSLSPVGRLFMTTLEDETFEILPNDRLRSIQLI